MKARLIVGLAALCALLSLSQYAMAHAQAYPNRPIKIIVPYTPGDGPDVIARLIGNKISERLGQPVLIENKAGASGQIGLDMTAKSPPDGYTLGVGLVTNLALAPHAYKTIPYDVLKDFAPVALGAVNYLALVARPDAPFKNVSEMIQWAKANPGKMTIGTTSTGGLPHMSFELLAFMSGFKFLNIPYKGNGPVVTDLTGGRLDLGVTSYTSIAGLADSGKLKVLGITNPTRDPALPNLPIPHRPTQPRRRRRGTAPCVRKAAGMPRGAIAASSTHRRISMSASPPWATISPCTKLRRRTSPRALETRCAICST